MDLYGHHLEVQKFEVFPLMNLQDFSKDNVRLTDPKLPKAML